MKYYFAYGSNLVKDDMQIRCPDSKVVGWGMLEGYRLVCQGDKGNAYLSVVEDPNMSVPVGMFEVSEKDIQSLDEYEDYPDMYLKKTVTLTNLQNNTNITGFFYREKENIPYSTPSGTYIAKCLEGYRDFGFDEAILLDMVFESISESQ